MIFHCAIIAPPGTHASSLQQDSEKLVPEAVAVFRQMLAEHGSTFQKRIPVEQFKHIEFRWMAGDSAALATFYADYHMVSTSALVRGLNPEEDRLVLAQLQQLWADGMKPTTADAGVDLVHSTERPLIVSVPWSNARSRLEDVETITDMQTCLAAAFFEGEYG